MSKKEKIKDRLLARRGWHNFPFNDIITLLRHAGFTHSRTSGSHQIYVNETIGKIITLQPVNGKCKPCQLAQIHDIIKEHKL